ncbi:MAG: TetR/AcrR family transcriptional regulator [bacterium]
MKATPERRPRRVPSQRPGPQGGKRDQNRREQVSRICGAAAGLMLAGGIEGVTIDAICREAGIAKGSFYRYFADKAELVAAIIEPLATAARAAIATCEAGIIAAHDFDALLAAYATFVMRLAPVLVAERDAVQLYLQESRAPGVGARAPVRALADEFGATAERLTLPAQAHGLLRDLPAAVTGRAVVGAVERLAFDVGAGAIPLDPAQVGAALLSMVFDGLRAART